MTGAEPGDIPGEEPQSEPGPLVVPPQQEAPAWRFGAPDPDGVPAPAPYEAAAPPDTPVEAPYETSAAAADEPPGGPTRRHRRRRPRRWVLILGGLVLVIIALGALAIPLLGVRSNANVARADLTQALTALRKGDLTLAQEKTTEARLHVDKASSAANGFGGDVWSVIPVAGGAVHDARHLVSALDDSTAIAEIGVSLYPAVLGDQATLITDEAVNLPELTKITAAAKEVGTRLAAAKTSLDEVKGSTPIVGKSVITARDAALVEVTSLQATLDRYQPILDVLPTIVGAQTDVSYLIAVANPAEMRSSGGATLSLGTVTFSKGKATFGDSGNTTDFTDNNEPIVWTPVTGDPWHTATLAPLVDATFSPYWTTSGEELLRAWQTTSGQNDNALIVIDLQAIATLFQITGPIDVPGYGKLTATNFVQTLAGSYDKFDDAAKRKQINSAIIPVLRTKLLEGGKFLQKAQALINAGAGRNFVVYSRNPAVEKVFSNIGLGGDLSTTPNDYIGVFSQNSNASKVDYWLKRTVASDVTVNVDGSADVTLTITNNNDSPPYTRKYTDPRRGYFTRWSIPGIIVYFPIGTKLSSSTANGTAFTPTMHVEQGRPYFQQFVTIPPNATSVMVIKYHVPAAAVVEAGGALRYNLAIDPHPLVNPVPTNITVHFPAGYSVGTLPDGWTRPASGAIAYADPGLNTSPRWSILATRTG